MSQECHVVLNKLCDIFFKNVFKKKEINAKMLNDRLIKLFVLLYFN